MATDPPADPFRVRLNWPEDVGPGSASDAPVEGEAAVGETGAATVRDEPTVAFEPGEEPDDSGSVLFTVASRLEGLRAALGNVGLRLDSLIRREEQFREFTTTRLAENAEQVAIAVGATRTAIEDQAREQQNLGEAVASMSERLDEIAEAVVSLPQILEEVEVIRAELVASIIRTETRDEELAMEVGRMAEELRVLRRRLPVRSRRGAPPPEAHVDPDEEFTPPRGRIRRRRAE